MTLKQYLMHVEGLEHCVGEQILEDIDNMSLMAVKQLEQARFVTEKIRKRQEQFERRLERERRRNEAEECNLQQDCIKYQLPERKQPFYRLGF